MKPAWPVIAAAALIAGALSCTSPAARVRLPATPPVFERQVRNAILTGDQDDRLRTLQQRVAGAPNDLPARLALIELYLERNLPDLAAEHCRIAAPRFPSSEKLHMAWARALYQAGLYRQGADALAGFLDANHGAPADAYAWLGILYDEAGYLEHGETAHRSASALEPNSAAFHNNLGYNLVRQGRKPEAAAEFRRALALEPGSAFARNNLALALLAPETSAVPQARSELEREALVNLRAAGGSAAAHNNLAALWIEQGRYAEARAELGRALRYNNSHAQALANLRLVSELDGKPAEIALPASVSPWSRWKSALKKTFRGSGSGDHQQRTAHAPARNTEKP